MFTIKYSFCFQLILEKLQTEGFIRYFCLKNYGNSSFFEVRLAKSCSNLTFVPIRSKKTYLRNHKFKVNRNLGLIFTSNSSFNNSLIKSYGKELLISK